MRVTEYWLTVNFYDGCIRHHRLFAYKDGDAELLVDKLVADYPIEPGIEFYDLFRGKAPNSNKAEKIKAFENVEQHEYDKYVEELENANTPEEREMIKFFGPGD